MSLLAKMRRTRYLMLVRSEEGRRRRRWKIAFVILDLLTNTIIVKSPWWVLLGRLNLILTPAGVTGFEVELITPLLRDGLLLWLLALVSGGGIPAIKLSQSPGETAQQWIYLRSPQPGRLGYIQTRFVALDIGDFLRSRQYMGAYPDMTDDERWRIPLAFSIILVVVALACTAAILLIAIWAAIATSGY